MKTKNPMNSNAPPKVLVLSRNYPNSVTPILGLWVENLVRHLSKFCEMKVIAPTPYCPPIPHLNDFTKFRAIEKKGRANGIEVLHPRFLVGPGNSTYSFESSLYYWSIRQKVDRLREEFPFDLIHANFSYPDGVVAAKLSARYNVPFIITEHASWIPWMSNSPQIRRQAVRAFEQCAFHIAVSRFARGTIASFTGDAEKLRIVPNGVDVDVFKPLQNCERMNANQILFVGLVRRVKGIDVLLEAMTHLIGDKPDARLIIVGGGVYRDYQSQTAKLRELSKELGVNGNVEFAGVKTQAEVAKYMRESALLVLPSRMETFGSVLIEALSCGTPVVATKCGGPEDIVNERVGRLVEKEDSLALARAINEVLDERQSFNSAELRNYALDNFSWERIAQQTIALYGKAAKAGNN